MHLLTAWLYTNGTTKTKVIRRTKMESTLLQCPNYIYRARNLHYLNTLIRIETYSTQM